MGNNKFEDELVKFDPQVAELTKIAEESSKITITDFTDKEQVAIVRSKRLELKDLRVQITKTGKTLRDDANAFNKKVLDKEKEMVSIIAPEEERLAQLEEEAAQKALIEKRKADLPFRLEKLELIGDGVTYSEDMILEMDDAQFTAYVNQRTSLFLERKKQKAEEEERERLAKIEAEKKEEDERKAKEEAEAAKKREEEQKKMDEEKAKIEADKKKLEADKKEFENQQRLAEIKKEAEIKAKKEAKEQAELEAKEKADREEREKKEAEEEKAREAAALKKREEYQKFLKDNGYSETTKNDFYLMDTEEKIVIYKKVNEFKK